MARLINVSGSTVDVVDRLAAVLVDLGNNSAASEAEILNTSLRIAAAGRQARLSEPEILAISAAMASTGLEAEAGGTAASRFFAELVSGTTDGGPRLAAFARVAGVSGDDFRQRFAEAPAEAIQLVLAGLQGVQDRGENVFAVLDDLGLGGLRTRDTMLRLAGAQDIVSDSLDRANEQWEANTALNAEAAVRFGTTEAVIQRVRNAWAKRSGRSARTRCR